VRNLRLIVHPAAPAAGDVAPEEIEAWLHARLDVLEPREEQLDELVNAGEASAELRAELERVRAELTFCLETLADLSS
jgi:hypothetical protein